jgi:phosphate:Na+ symporter
MKILLNLLAGVALLVWGTHIVRTGILSIWGGDLRRFLRESVANRYAAFGAGLGITALIQSSNATALMVASFAGQGLIATAPALAVMLGADVGTALMTLVFSLDLSWLSPTAHRRRRHPVHAARVHQYRPSRPCPIGWD